MKDDYSTYINCSDELNILFSKKIYVSEKDSFRIINKYHKVDITKKNQIIILLGYLKKIRILKAIKAYKAINNIRNKIEKRDKYNQQLIEFEQNKEFISNNQKLDKQQIEAVVACEDASLVLAPAGSGKTLSLLAKIEYIVNKLKIKPGRVLAISFTKKTVEELKDRVGIKGVNIYTFHSLGNKIFNSQAVSRHKLIQEKQIQKFIRDTINSLLENDKKYAKMYNDYLLFYHSTPIDLTQLKTLKEIVEFNKSFLRQSLQSISLNKKYYDKKRPTLNNEYIRSKEEQIIANWLFINQIPYEYERQYDYIDTKYKPDFTLTMFEEPVYLEHFALRKDGTSHYKNYTSSVEWKRKLHKDNKTKLIESYTYQWSDGTLLSHIEKQIKLVGVRSARLAESKITKLMQDSAQYQADIRSFEELIINFLTLQKNGMYTKNDLVNIIANAENKYLKNRAEQFFSVYEPIYDMYEKHLRTNKMIDFADMINRSIEIIEKSDIADDAYDYILIDEVQDLSTNRYKLMKALLDKSSSSKLFAVGDDWQSIYRFAGGDLSLIQDFENTFNLKTRRSYIGMTHRFGNPQLDVSSIFVQKNPYQSQKSVFASSSITTPVLNRLYTSTNFVDNQPRVDQQACAVDSIIEGLANEYGDDIHNKSIQLISRYNSDINVILGDKNRNIKAHDSFKKAREYNNDVNKNKDNEIKLEWSSKINSRPIKLTFCSMHKAKGITRDIVIVLNMNAGNNGMPSLRTSDPLIELLLAHPDQYPFSEERRLFYVAITRAKLVTYLISDRANPSQFMFEIFDDFFGKSNTCSKCNIGEMVDRSGPYGAFRGCSNFKYGCDYIER